MGLGLRPDVWAACGERMATCSKWQSEVEKSAMSYCKAAFKFVWSGVGKEKRWSELSFVDHTCYLGPLFAAVVYLS